MHIRGTGAQKSLQDEYKRIVQETFARNYFEARKPVEVYQNLGRVGNLDVVVSTNCFLPSIDPKKPNVLELPCTILGNLSVFRDGKKLLIYIREMRNWSSLPFGLWFAGTDDKSNFITSFEPKLYNTFLHFGEDVFLEALKPDLTQSLEKYFNVSCQRQGDMLVTRFPYTKSACERFAVAYFDDFEYNSSYNKKGTQLFGTRHKFSGQYYGPSSGNAVLVAHGKIEAPNHPTMKLKGVHIIQQNAGLVSPRFAD